MKLKGRRLSRGILAALLTAIVLNPASGGTTLALEGRVNTTYDPNTGLEWLNLGKTIGQSYESVLAGWNGYTTVHGYRFATKEEIVTLFIHAGAVEVHVSGPPDWSSFVQENIPAAELLLSLMGATTVGEDLIRSFMLYDPASESVATEDEVPVAMFGVLNYNETLGFFAAPAHVRTLDFAGWDASSALVRSVPEPSGAAMFLIAPCLVLLRRARC